MSQNLPPGVTVKDCEGPTMPKCVRCEEEVNTVNDVGLCEDCAEEESEGVDAMKWVSQECKRLTEHLATTQEGTVSKPLEFMPTGQVAVLPPVHPSWYKK